MPQDQRHIYRSSNAILGGVCAGFAERFDMDTALFRVLAVVLTVLSAGFFAFVYLAVWLILPPIPEQNSLVDVDPELFRSEVYEQVVRGSCNTHLHTVASAAAFPPRPPEAASHFYGNQGVTYAQVPFEIPETKSARSSSVVVGVIGVLIILLGIAVFFTNTFDVFALVQLWPFAFIVVGLFIIGRASKSNLVIVAAGVVLIVFFIAGAYISFQEEIIELGASLPFGPESFGIGRG